MIDATLEITFESEWIVAGGDSVLGTADIAPMKDEDGFPFVPGRSLRGILREAVALVDDCTGHAWATALFGERIVPDGGRHYQEGTVHVGNAVLAAELAACASANSRVDLYTTVRRTALTEGRVARRHTLRELEVCVPGLVLVASMHVPHETALHVLSFGCGLVRSLGHGRSRGLGRCRLELLAAGQPVDVTHFPPAPGQEGVA